MKVKKRFDRIKQLKGQFTIEASVIVPITLLIVAAVLTIVFALHDRIIFTTVTIYEVMAHAQDDPEDPDLVCAAAAEMLGKRLVTAEGTEVSLETSEDAMTLSAGGDVPIALGSVRALVGAETERIDTRIKVSNLKGRETLIRYKTICDGISAIGGNKEE